MSGVELYPIGFWLQGRLLVPNPNPYAVIYTNEKPVFVVERPIDPYFIGGCI
jgi:hypothetical protein